MNESPSHLSDEELTQMIYESQATIKNTQILTARVAERLSKFNELYSALDTKPDKAALIYRDPTTKAIRWKAIGTRLVVGRAPRVVVNQPETQLVINDPEMSRDHFQIVPDADGLYTLTDLNSTNGTTINGKDQKTVVLVAGAEVLAGQTSFLFAGGFA